MNKMAHWGFIATLAWAAWAVPAAAMERNKPETLTYRVAWGPIGVGKATLSYTPGAAQAYRLEVAMKDNTALVEFNSRWQVEGDHTAAPFVPRSYHAVQQENDYRADKRVVFDKAKGEIRYTNNRDAADVEAPRSWAGAAGIKDVFSQLYAWRGASVESLKQPAELQVMGTKRPFTLVRGALQPMKPKDVVGLPDQGRPLWQARLQSRKDDGSLSRDRWVITLREEAGGSLTPVRIQAQTKFGNFTATLR